MPSVNAVKLLADLSAIPRSERHKKAQEFASLLHKNVLVASLCELIQAAHRCSGPPFVVSLLWCLILAAQFWTPSLLTSTFGSKQC